MKKQVICLGDSLTKGMAGYSYIDYLENKNKYINKGLNNDTLMGAFERLLICMNEYPKVNDYVISIGINDVLLPYLSSLSSLWYKECKLTKLDLCLNNDDDFILIYDTMLSLLKSNHKNVLILGMPVIQIDGFPLEKELQRNNFIKELADKYDYNFVDVYELQKNYIKEYNTISWNQKNFRILFDYYLMATKPSSKDKLSEKKNLELTVDGVHYNKVSAELIALEVDKYLK
jgi:sulfur transfer complex TusBCD TusB component (DsrH family)